MGFYYGSSDPGGGDEPGGWRETIAIIFVVFRVLAMPLGILLGSLLAVFGTIWLFTVNMFLGLGIVVVLLGSLVARGVWEAKHPPELR